VTPSARAVANRRNAKRSTGPKSKQGRERSARNAFRHGLAVPITATPDVNSAVGRLAKLLVGADEAGPSLEWAIEAAQAELDLIRVRAVKNEIVGYLGRYHHMLHGMNQNRKLLLMSKLFGRYKDDETARTVKQDFLTDTGQPAHSRLIADIIDELFKELHAIDRYERRALSRRKFAIRALAAGTGSS
jgi:hypothetical protein